MRFCISCSALYLYLWSSGARETAITGHCIWSHDAHVIMKDISHLKLITMSLLQTCSYVTEQMQTNVTIDINKFMESFSINQDEGPIHPPFWNMLEDDQVRISSLVPSVTASQSSSLSMLSKPFNMEDYRRCQQAEAICWIDLQEKRASIIARLQPVTPEEYQIRRNAVNCKSGPLRRRDKRQPGRQYIQHGMHDKGFTVYASSR